MPKPIIGDDDTLERDRYDELKFKLKEAFRNKDYRLNNREPTDTGLSYTREATEHGLVLNAWSRLPYLEKRIIKLWLEDGMTIVDIAREVRYSRSWVSTKVRASMQTMIAIVWDDSEERRAG
jgi:DNA-directed RNA polymerase specialized sigma subunit